MTGAWTSNWENMKRTWATGVSTGAVGAIKNTSQNTVLGYDMRAMSTPLMPVYGGSGVNTSNVTIRFGGPQGASPTPSASDYNIFGPITSGIVYDAVVNDDTVAYDPSTGIATRTSKVTIRNTQNDSKTFKEWGLFGCVPYKSGNNTYTAEVLLYRAVFDEPITLTQHESLTLTITRGVQIDVPQS